VSLSLKVHTTGTSGVTFETLCAFVDEGRAAGLDPAAQIKTEHTLNQHSQLTFIYAESSLVEAEARRPTHGVRAVS
jgi:hypothetical protein